MRPHFKQILGANAPSVGAFPTILLPMAITNPSVSSYGSLADMLADPHHTQPTSLPALYEITHRTTEGFGDRKR
ncbi:hypothetical protein CCANI_04525 [Corynebacterium canis]|nr:hypothetical protein CCANI_04525 [Corynebacterium canis]